MITFFVGKGHLAKIDLSNLQNRAHFLCGFLLSLFCRFLIALFKIQFRFNLESRFCVEGSIVLPLWFFLSLSRDTCFLLV